MNSFTATDARSLSRSRHIEAEKVGLRRIRLSLSCQSLSASVGTFFAADKVLLAWATRHQGPLECEFEIVYDDGQTIAGDYRFFQRPPARPALMVFVRKTLTSLCEGTGKAALVRGLVDGAQNFLAHYETEDFMSN